MNNQISVSPCPKRRSPYLCRLTALTLLAGLSMVAQAKTETFTLTADVPFSDEAAYFKTNKGNVPVNVYALPASVNRALDHLNLNKGACIEVTSTRGFFGTDEDGSGIQSIRNCAAGQGARNSNKGNPPASAKSSNSAFQVNRAANQLSRGSCHMDSCSWSKSISTKVIRQNSREAVLKVTLLGATSENSAAARAGHPKRLVWNKAPHSLGFTCSYTKPSLTVDGQTDILPLNAGGVPGILESSAGLYFKYCHSYSGSVDSGIHKFGYNVE